MHIFRRHAGLGLSATLLVGMIGCQRAPAPAPPAPTPDANGLVLMAQGWDDATREAAWFDSFGSRLVPYRWLGLLEMPGSTQRFASDAHMTTLGFLTAPPSAHNARGYPVGFAPTTDAQGQTWVGLGCAACHTGEIHHDGHRYRIDGAPGLIDFTNFERELIDSLSATAGDADKFNRFANGLGVTRGPERQTLQNQMVLIAQSLEARHRINATQVPYGHGRLDAFGQIFNAVAVQALGIPENTRAPDAPVSFPALWSAPHLDLVQWNGSAPNAGPGPLLQNVTTALAVYNRVDLQTSHLGGYDSDVEFNDLGKIQDRFYHLQSPQWPSADFGAPDAAAATRGARTYAQQCQSCHTLSDRNDAKRKLQTVMVPLDQIGTDPRMVENFLNANVRTGVLQGRKQAVLAGPVFGATARSIDVVIHAAIGATLRHPLVATKEAVVGYHKTLKAGIDQFPRHYKARPLDGIWASAPYLHNGSVPNLADLLLPPAQRPVTFIVGKRDYDVHRLGYVSDGPTAAGTNIFDTRLPGNGNAGHSYGTDLTPAERADLLEYLKTL